MPTYLGVNPPKRSGGETVRAADPEAARRNLARTVVARRAGPGYDPPRRDEQCARPEERFGRSTTKVTVERVRS